MFIEYFVLNTNLSYSEKNNFILEELTACSCGCCELLLQLYNFILIFSINSSIFAVQYYLYIEFAVKENDDFFF
ncbi:hypothetical protein GCM10023314_32130 [Algibacter agarivorans]|uniref:Uncharacterized protein n=1 Tax=Algibacter agarivorans TaxID=1109741 RepID=A0ABP9GZG1_9FLAO